MQPDLRTRKYTLQPNDVNLRRLIPAKSGLRSWQAR